MDHLERCTTPVVTALSAVSPTLQTKSPQLSASESVYQRSHREPLLLTSKPFYFPIYCHSQPNNLKWKALVQILDPSPRLFLILTWRDPCTELFERTIRTMRFFVPEFCTGHESIFFNEGQNTIRLKGFSASLCQLWMAFSNSLVQTSWVFLEHSPIQGDQSFVIISSYFEPQPNLPLQLQEEGQVKDRLFPV